jgi:peptide/nickel transport system ATP-binding protein
MYAGRIAEIGPVRDVIKHANHPYTRGLMGAIPTLEAGSERLAQIPGSMPRLSEIPPGCAFNPRCGEVMPNCRTLRPELQTVGASRVACHLYVQGASAGRAAR